MNQTWTKYLPSFLQQKLDGRHYLQNVVSNTGWQFADSILRMVVGLIVGIWVARYLGPEKFGLFSYAIAFVALFSPIASLGLDDIAVRNLVRDPADKEETLGTAFVLKLTGGALSFFAATGSILVLRPADDLSHWLVGIIAVGAVFQAFTAIDFWFNSQVQAKYSVLAKNSAFLICSAIKVVLIISKAPLVAFAWVGMSEVVIGSAGLVVAYMSTGAHILDWRGSLKMARGLLKDSWPLVFSIIAIIVYQRIDQVMLGEMVNSEEVGIYSVAVRLAEVWLFIPTAVYWSVLPSIVEARAISEVLFYDSLQKYYNLMALMAYAIALPVTFLGGWLVTTLFGEAYARAGMMLAILIWANLFIYLEVARSSFFTAMNWNKIYFVTLLLGAVTNILLNLFLIPRYGGVGAAIASLIAYWFAAHGSCFLFKSLFKTGLMLSKAIAYPKIW
ncbi:Polysaccharide biosynthesis protein [Candidatus Sulfobium mesophilum]|uniref:Polysaccharide biosynthesis protein n=1 Tax=Candidatus Sulfobium mesophilum TaxID=2016548 RepID=A0A2U3QEZ9_9BACT|nr:Polysaccharide biosynthesis protein [Candidatus Sulfobium mesophilum]